MSSIYVPGRVVMRHTWQPMDPDAAAYIAAVEQADGQALEEKVKIAIDNFVLGCKADGIWSAIKASCILAGARTLNGALVPLVGAAPTNFNFVAGDYNRKTGLVGNGSTKYLNSNRANNAGANAQNNHHFSAYVTTLGASGASQFPAFLSVDAGASGSTGLLRNQNNGSSMISRSRSATAAVTAFTGNTGLGGVSRSASDSYNLRIFGASTTIIQASQTPSSNTFYVYADNTNNNPNISAYNASRLAFYSIGEALDLALLDARVTALINAFAAAIP